MEGSGHSRIEKEKLDVLAAWKVQYGVMYVRSTESGHTSNR